MIDDDRANLLALYHQMARGRALEERVIALMNSREFRGFYHPGRGQEGVQAGVCSVLRKDDYLMYAHRGLTYLTAKGMDPALMLGDFLGRVGGSTGGLGAGTVHCVDVEHGIMGQGGTLGTSFTLTGGLALASQVLKQGRIATAFFGDGASARGTFLEAGVTIAAWKLPVLWICENNGWAVSARLADVQGTEDIAPRAAALGFYTEVVDGQDVQAVQAAARRAADMARDGRPAFIEAKTIRVDGHYAGDTQPYRDKDDVASAKDRDPMKLAREVLLGWGVTDEELTRIRDDSGEEMSAAEARARLSPEPTGERIFEGLWV